MPSFTVPIAPKPRPAGRAEDTVGDMDPVAMSLRWPDYYRQEYLV